MHVAQAQPASWTRSAAEYARLARGVATVSVVTTKDGRFWRLVAWSTTCGRRATSFAETISSWAYLKTWPRGWAQRVFQRRAEEVIDAWRRRTSPADRSPSGSRESARN